MKSQPELPLRAMSGSLTIERQESLLISMVILPLKNMGTSLFRTAVRTMLDHVQRMCRTGPAPHWLGHSGELAPSLTSSIIQHSGVGLGSCDVGEPVPRV